MVAIIVLRLEGGGGLRISCSGRHTGPPASRTIAWLAETHATQLFDSEDVPVDGVVVLLGRVSARTDDVKGVKARVL